MELNDVASELILVGRTSNYRMHSIPSNRIPFLRIAIQREYILFASVMLITVRGLRLRNRSFDVTSTFGKREEIDR